MRPNPRKICYRGALLSAVFAANVLQIFAQPFANEVLLGRMVEKHLTQLGPLNSISVMGSSAWLPPIKSDTASVLSYQIGVPSIKYDAHQQGMYLRRIMLPLLLVRRDQSQPDTLRYVDTLSYRQLRQVLRRSADEFRGEDPSFRGKWLIPLTSISLGTGITVALFYLRSRR